MKKLQKVLYRTWSEKERAVKPSNGRQKKKTKIRSLSERKVKRNRVEVLGRDVRDARFSKV